LSSLIRGVNRLCLCLVPLGGGGAFLGPSDRVGSFCFVKRDRRFFDLSQHGAVETLPSFQMMDCFCFMAWVAMESLLILSDCCYLCFWLSSRGFIDLFQSLCRFFPQPSDKSLPFCCRNALFFLRATPFFFRYGAFFRAVERW